MNIAQQMKEKAVPMLKAIGITMILNFVCYAFLAQFIGAGKLDGYYSPFIANLLASVSSTVLYAILFHWFYTTKANKRFLLDLKPDQAFSWKKEGRLFFKEECVPFLILYAVFIVVFEIVVTFTVLLNTRMHWLAAYCYAFLFPLRISDDKLNLFLSPFLSVAVLVLLIWFLALFGRKRLYKKLKNGF